MTLLVEVASLRVSFILRSLATFTGRQNFREEKMNCIYISDTLGDDNARGRITTRLLTGISGSVFTSVTPIGVDSEVEGFVQLVDQLDATRGNPSVILFNVAPRGVNKKKLPNGSPFGYLKVGNANIFPTTEGRVLPLLQNLLGTRLRVRVHEICPEVLGAIGIPRYQWKYVTSTQFRSYEFLPDLANAVMSGREIPGREIAVARIRGSGALVGVVDKFGNIKSTALPGDIGFRPGRTLTLSLGGSEIRLPCYPRLKDVPCGVLATVVGSSGLWVGRANKRFVELVVQKGDAGSRLHDLTGVTVAPGLKLNFE